MADALAFWLREPGVGEIRPVGVPDPGAGEVRVRTLRSAVSRGTESLVFRGAVPEDQYAAMRAPFQEGDFPGPVKYGYLNVGGSRRARRSCATARCSRSSPTRRRTSSRRARSPSCPTTCRRAGPCWPARSRPRSTRSGTPRPMVGDRVAVVGAGMVGCCVARLLAAVPGVERHPGRRRPGPGGGRRRARRRASPLPDDADDGRDLVVHTSATSAGLQRRSTCSRRGHGPRPQLVRRRRGHALARRRVPLRPARDPGQPGRHRRPGPERRDAPPPTGWRSRSTCCATRPSTPCSPARRASTTCPT